MGACLDDVCGDACLLAWLQASEDERWQLDSEEAAADHRCVASSFRPPPPLVLNLFSFANPNL